MKLFHEVSTSTLNLPPDTFIYKVVLVDALHSITNGALQFVVASSDDSLTLLSVLGHQLKVQHSIKGIHRSISCVQLCDLYSLHKHIITAGRDGFIRFWSLEHFSQHKPSLEIRTPNGKGISAIAQCQVKNLLAAGTELLTDGPGDVAVYVWNVSGSELPGENQGAQQPILAFTESHTDTITNLSFHQSWRNNERVFNLVTSSTDGLVNIFDLEQPDEDEAVISVVNARSAVQYFLCVNDSDHAFGDSGLVCTVSQDEKIAMHDLSSAGGSKDDSSRPQDDWDIRNALNCDYVIDLRPTHDSSMRVPADLDNVILAVGACKSENPAYHRVDIYVTPWSSLGTKLMTEPTIRLSGAHGEEVVRDVWLQNECPIILSCGEDGRVRAWKLESGDVEMSVPTEKPEEEEERPRKKQKQRKK